MNKLLSLLFFISFFIFFSCLPTNQKQKINTSSCTNNLECTNPAIPFCNISTGDCVASDPNGGGTEYEIGDIGPGDGIVFYDKGSYSNGWRYLEVATRSEYDNWKIWQDPSYNISGTEAEIGKGKANTQAIIDWVNQDSNNRNAPAAEFCNNFSYGQKNDWFLPSKDELNQIYINEDIIFTIFEPYYYWSSTQNSNEGYKAWRQSMHSGEQLNTPKNISIDICCIRTF